jgi:hypothetical protein
MAPKKGVESLFFSFYFLSVFILFCTSINVCLVPHAPLACSISRTIHSDWYYNAVITEHFPTTYSHGCVEAIVAYRRAVSGVERSESVLGDFGRRTLASRRIEVPRRAGDSEPTARARARAAAGTLHVTNSESESTPSHQPPASGDIVSALVIPVHYHYPLTRPQGT